MKTIVLAMVLACALAANAQEANQAQTQPVASGGGQSQAAPEIKDPAEYNAYVGAIQQQDPKAKLSALEAFLVQYPNSVMKTTALELLMNTYLQANDQAKVVETAKRLLTADSCNLRALALLTYLARQGVASGQNPQQNLADLKLYSNKGLECVKTASKPAGLKDEEFDKLKKETTLIFNGGAGFEALQTKDCEHAQQYLNAAVEAGPDDLQNVYPLAMTYLTCNPTDTLKGIFFIARAANLATGPSQAQIQKYGLTVYKNYHGSDEGWNGVLFTAKSNPLPPAGFTISKYVPPTPAQQAHDIVNGKTPDQIKQLSFGEWELVLSAGSPEDQDKVWSVIKGVPLQMEGTVIAATTTELQIAASEDDIEKKQADITVTMSGTIPPRLMPKVGESLDFEGTPLDYTSQVHNPSGASTAPPADSGGQPAAGLPTPGTPSPATTTPPAGATPTAFMMTMEKGALLKKAGTTPARKPPARHRPARPPQ